MTHTPDRKPKLSQDARATFDRALAKSVDQLFNQPVDVAATLLDEFLAGRLILVLARDAMWARPVEVEDASAPRPEFVAPDDTPGMYL